MNNPSYYVLLYDYVDDYLTRRTQFRPEHLRLANEAHARGELVLGGAFSDTPHRGLLIFRVTDRKVIEHFVQNDPYVINGVVARWEIRPWTVVIGNDLS